MATTIKDIADLANVSLTTVSLVLNGRPGVSLETRERVLKLAHDMRYEKPGSGSGGSGNAAHGTIRFLKIARHGHTVNRDHTVFISDYLDGITHGARTHNLTIEISTFNAAPIDEVIESLRSSNDLQGAIVLGTELSRDDVCAFRAVPIPLLFLDTFIDFIAFDFVDMNNTDSVYRAIEHFVERGHTEIGMVRSSVQTRNFQLRYTGFIQTMKALSCPIHERCIFDCDSTYDGAYEDMRTTIRSGARLPSALFCTNDIIAYGVMKAIREAGYRIPDDVSIIGFDDLPSSALMDPPLTTIAVSKWEIGNAAVNRLTQRMLNRDSPAVKIVIGGQLIERNSVRDLT
ncbi:MAG: LacI family transcriptional regulator [Spirochaetaceae bacterium]|nr:MAG: LacI family transcriptional regulator [Spirochaetaceae bacterium]